MEFLNIFLIYLKNYTCYTTMNDREGQHLWSVLKYILAWILRGGEDKKWQYDQQFPGWGSRDGLCECEMCFIGLHFYTLHINIIK
jgi:hypothetical protein